VFYSYNRPIDNDYLPLNVDGIVLCDFRRSSTAAVFVTVKLYIAKMAGSGYRGNFGRVSAVEFFKRDDWYNQMFIVNGGITLFNQSINLVFHVFNARCYAD